MREAEGQRVSVRIEKKAETRSQQANRRYWGCLVPLAGHFLSQSRDIPLSKDQTHFVLVSAFAGCEEAEVCGAKVLVPVSTHTMTKEQFHLYCERVEVWLAEQGYHVPDSPGVELEGVVS